MHELMTQLGAKFENAFDRVYIFGAASWAATVKTLNMHDFLSNSALALAVLLGFLRCLDWFIRRYKFGWKHLERDADEKD